MHNSPRIRRDTTQDKARKASLSIPTICTRSYLKPHACFLRAPSGGFAARNRIKFEVQIGALNSRPEALPMCGTLWMLRFDQRSVLMRLFPYLHVQFPQQLNSQECKPQV